MVAGLPARKKATPSTSSVTPGAVENIDKAKRRENFAVFLKAIIPVAEEVGVRMAVHPDDPPCPILGRPRIVSTIEEMQWMVDNVNSRQTVYHVHRFLRRACYNDLVDTTKQFGPRYLLHPSALHHA
ncbi:mannonate dehydratase [Escherichia coli]